MLQRLALDFPSGKPQPKLFCPSCGALVMNEEVEVPQPACRHVTFFYLDDTEEFIYIEPKLEDLIQAARDQDDERLEDNNDYQVLLQAYPESGSAFVYEETTNGRPCGPSSTAAVGFELARDEEN